MPGPWTGSIDPAACVAGTEWTRRLEARIIELAREFGRYGYRRITALQQREGWGVDHKHVERIWCREGLGVPRKQPKRGRLSLNDGSCVRLRAQRPKNHGWSYVFVHDRTHDGRPLKPLTTVDEFTRECLCIDVVRRLPSEDVLNRARAADGGAWRTGPRADRQWA